MSRIFSISLRSRCKHEKVSHCQCCGILVLAYRTRINGGNFFVVLLKAAYIARACDGPFSETCIPAIAGRGRGNRGHGGRGMRWCWMRLRQQRRVLDVAYHGGNSRWPYGACQCQILHNLAQVTFVWTENLTIIDLVCPIKSCLNWIGWNQLFKSFFKLL